MRKFLGVAVLLILLTGCNDHGVFSRLRKAALEEISRNEDRPSVASQASEHIPTLTEQGRTCSKGTVGIWSLLFD